MKLIIAEKPSVAMEIAKVVGASNREKGYLEGGGYLVSWCVGHLVALATPEMYDETYKKWKLEDLPILPEPYQTTVSANTAAQYGILKSLMHRKDVGELICATDAGREGELIFRLVYEQAKCRKPFWRLWVSSLEKSAIERALRIMKAGSEYDNLYYAARCRQRADWLIGINLTRLYTAKYGKVLNTGRVQAPTINLLVERQREIESFVPVPFYNVFAIMDDMSALCRLEDKEQAYRLSREISGKKARVTSVVQEKKKENPPRLFDLTALQREANRLFGFSAKQTLDTAQSLYEAKLITYPRTDSRFLTADMQESAGQLVQHLKNEFSGWIPPGTVDQIQTARLISDKKVRDHHALLPTKELNMEKYALLPSSEKKVAVLLLFRLLEAVAKPFQFQLTKAGFEIEGAEFAAKGRTIQEAGYTEITAALMSRFVPDFNREKKESVLPALCKGDILPVHSARVEEKQTQPPQEYTEDTLLSAMETAGKNIPEDELREAMRDCGLGTPATRAEIIESLFRNQYAVREKKKILPTDTAFKYVDLVCPELKEPEMTAQWEKQLAEIAQGAYSEAVFMDTISQFVSEVVKSEKKQSAEIHFEPRPERKTESFGKCPLCGQDIVKRSKSFSCSAGKEHCGFLIWRTILGKELTDNAVRKMLEKGRSDLIKGFTGKSGKKFNAFLVMDEKGKVSFAFPKN